MQAMQAAQTAILFPTLKQGDRGRAVEELQALINDRFFVNPIGGIPIGGVIIPVRLDGIYGPRTEEAVRLVQFRYLLPQNGIAESKTWRSLQADQALIDALPVLRRGDRGQDIIVIQATLNAADVGPTDGVFGARTEAAVKAYQVTRNIRVDGIVGSVTWRALEQRAFARLV